MAGADTVGATGEPIMATAGADPTTGGAGTDHIVHTTTATIGPIAACIIGPCITGPSSTLARIGGPLTTTGPSTAARIGGEALSAAGGLRRKFVRSDPFSQRG